MKILYAAGDRPEAGRQLGDFVSSCAIRSDITVKIAAYVSASTHVEYIDWTLDAVKTNRTAIKHLTEDIEEFCPDIIINDCEKYTAKLSHKLGIELWYCSPLNIVDAISWSGRQKYSYYYVDACRDIFGSLPKCDRRLIYSPFGAVSNGPTLKKNFEWVCPSAPIVQSRQQQGIVVNIAEYSRYNIIADLFDRGNISADIYSDRTPEYFKAIAVCDKIITSGDSLSAADAILNSKSLYTITDFSSIESVLNSLLIESYNIGVNMGQIELMGKYAADELISYISQYSAPCRLTSGIKHFNHLL